MAQDTSDNDDGLSFADPLKYMESFTKMQTQFFENMASVLNQGSDMFDQGGDKASGEKADALGASPFGFFDEKTMSQNMEAGIEVYKNIWEKWPESMKQAIDHANNLYNNKPNDNGGRKDKRFRHDAWDSHPYFALMRQNYQFFSAQAEAWLENQDNMSARDKEKLKFQLDQFFDAMSPSNYIVSNPEIVEKAIKTKGESLQKGMQNALKDMGKGQLTHTDPNAFELGVNIANTPGKVVHETRLYQLIQYEPMTKDQLAVPLVIFPPWINRYYILDLNEEKSFVKWALKQGISVFMVSWKSADASMADIIWDDYVRAEIDAIDTIRDGLNVDSVHAIGYCVAGTTLNAALSILHHRGEEHKVKSATFFTTQVDFEDAGDLKAFTTDTHVKLLDSLSSQGYLDGRVMAMTFNMLRSKDLIWNYVVNNYLLGNDYPAFDLLHWNGDTTNLPAAWHNSYINDLYRENLLVIPNRLSVDGTPIDLRRIKTPAYIQAGIEDHIAPAKSVWKLRNYLSGPTRFTLAGSGHIAGVVNHPDAQKYQYWRNDAEGLDTLDDFIAGAKETKGSWWPDWLEWLKKQDDELVTAKGAYIPGKGKLKAIEEAPGRYVRMQ